MGSSLLGFIGPAIPFLPRFSLLAKLIRQAMKVDTYAVIDLFGKNVQIKKRILDLVFHDGRAYAGSCG